MAEWSNEQIEQFKALWDEGATVAEISRRLGVSKNSIAGKRFRLGLKTRPSPIKRALNATQNPPAARIKRAPKITLPAIVRKAPEPIIVFVPAPEPKPVVTTFRPLSAIPCCFPLGDPGKRSFRFCEAPSVVGKPYCPEHCAAAYVRVAARSATSQPHRWEHWGPGKMPWNAKSVAREG